MAGGAQWTGAPRRARSAPQEKGILPSEGSASSKWRELSDGSIRGTMTNLEETSRPAASLGVAERWLPALLLLFVGSGCAALIYEVVWFQLLQLSIGSSAVSLGVLLGVYMGGMCLGSLLLPRYLSPTNHPLRVYAFL